MKQKRVGLVFCFLLGAWAVNAWAQHLAHSHGKQFDYYETFGYALSVGFLLAVNAVLIAMLIRDNSDLSAPDAYKWAQPAEFRFFTSDLFFMVWFIIAGLFILLHAYISFKLNHPVLVFNMLGKLLRMTPYLLGITLLFLALFEVKRWMEGKMDSWADTFRKRLLWVVAAIILIALLYVGVGDLSSNSKLLTDGEPLSKDSSSQVSTNNSAKKDDSATNLAESQKKGEGSQQQVPPTDPNATPQQQLGDALKNRGTATASTPGATATASPNGCATAATTTSNEGDGDH